MKRPFEWKVALVTALLGAILLAGWSIWLPTSKLIESLLILLVLVLVPFIYVYQDIGGRFITPFVAVAAMATLTGVLRGLWQDRYFTSHPDDLAGLEDRSYGELLWLTTGEYAVAGVVFGLVVAGIVVASHAILERRDERWKATFDSSPGAASVGHDEAE